MMFTSSMTVIVHRTARDAFGDLVDTAAHTVQRCGLLRHSTSEDRDARDQVTETATLALPAGADITATDDVTLPDGSRWHVDGRPYVPHSPLTGWEPATAVPLRRVSG